MDIGIGISEWSAARDLSEIFEAACEQGLERNLAELATFGFTTIPDALPRQLIDERLVPAICDAVTTSTGVAPNLETGEGHDDINFAPFLLYRDPAFEQALMNRPVLTLIQYLLGRSCVLSSLSSHFKGPGQNPLALHSDNGNGTPSPFPSWSMVANCNYALTDYTREGGALAMVPGSHLLCRHPLGDERNLIGDVNPQAVPIEVPAGTAIIWHGNTWHGSFARSIPGVRINLSMYFCRQFVAPQEDYRGTIGRELLERNDDQFATLMGQHVYQPWRLEGPDWDKHARARETASSLHS
ncbi:MAG: phytanoyl-CoA dioxygenase family protein [Desertimonas sp.]